MGNREDPLQGAKLCLYEKGYFHTTARDIATAAGVSLAAIGYHYGTKDALLNEPVSGTATGWLLR
ncbi:TetR/AcrR family transcriptional regulator [Nonomuraea glycinis]|uniref:TetR/AcrR family transcriptional regulator n=1 Tax=Nonomuraea glycinis TaxID=2047744 RepID=UPI003F4BD0E9